MNIIQDILEKLEAVDAERERLKVNHDKLKETIRACGITRNAITFMRHKIDERTLLVRDNAAYEIRQIEIELRPLNVRRRQLKDELFNLQNGELITVLKEVFSKEQWSSIEQECQSRLAGNSPHPMNFNLNAAQKSHETKREYAELASKAFGTMIEIRELLTRVIEDGCNKFDKGEFMKVMSPLNRLIAPISELKKIKRQYNIK